MIISMIISYITRPPGLSLVAWLICVSSMRPLLKLVILGDAITAARGRVTPGLCFELQLAPGGRYSNLAAVAAKAKGRLAGDAMAAAGTRAAVAAALEKRAALRQNPKCIALDESVRAGKGKCRPGKGIFCNARHRCYGNSACALCEP